MRVIRAIVGTQPKQKPVKKSKKTSEVISKEKVEKSEKKKRGRPKGSKNKVDSSIGPFSFPKQITLKGKVVLPQHLALYRLWKSADEYTAHQAAEKAMCTKNVAYTFGYRHDVKWAKARRTK